MKLSEIKKLSGGVWFLILGTMLSKASYFISMPYLALRMKSALNLSPLMIGVTLGLGPLIGIFAGFYVGHLSDHWGRKTIFTVSNLIWSLTFLGFGLATEYWHFAVLNLLNGLCNSATHPVSAALISDMTPAPLRKTAFHFRYFAINLGASFGPYLGAWFLLRDPSWGFYLTAVIYLLYAAACALRLPADSAKRHAGSGAPAATFGETLRVLSEDKPLRYYTLAFILMGATYCQLDATLPQYLQGAKGDDGVRLFGLLMGVNAMTVVVGQLPLTRLMSRFSLMGTVRSGSFVYAVGMALMGIVGLGRAPLIASMIILTLGEILIFSNGSLVIDQIAPESKKGAYFGASGLWAVGSSVGPALGGYVLMKAGGPALFVILGAVGACNVLVYRLGELAQRRHKAVRTGGVPDLAPEL